MAANSCFIRSCDALVKWHCNAERDQTGLFIKSFFIASKSPSFILFAASSALGFAAEGTSDKPKFTAIAKAGRLVLVRVPANLKSKKKKCEI